MPRPRLAGVIVKPLFRLLRLLNVPQTAACRRLGVAKPTVSAWATGTRPLSPRYHRRFFAFVAHRLDDALARQHAFKAAMELIRKHTNEGSTIPPDILSPEQQEAFRGVFGPLPNFIGPKWAVADALLRSGSRDPQYPSLAEQVVQLLDEWWLATQHVELYRELWDQCRRVGAYGAPDFETFWQRVSGSARERIALRRAADTLATRARRLDRVVVPLGAEPLLAQREAWQALAAHPRAGTEPREPHGSP